MIAERSPSLRHDFTKVAHAETMDFTSTNPFLQTGGVPDLGENFDYVGAVDPNQ